MYVFSEYIYNILIIILVNSSKRSNMIRGIQSQDPYGLFKEKPKRKMFNCPAPRPQKKRQVNISISNSIDNYNKIRVLGEGAYGLVYQAIDKNTNQVVAIKKIKQTEEDDKYGVSTTILREISVLQETCSHKNIVSLHKHFTTNGFAGRVDYMYIVMEYVPMTLRQYIEDTTLFHLDNVKKIMKQLLEVMEFLHCKLFLHRDLKPQNILLTPSIEIKITDFGLSRRFNPLKTDRRYTNEVVTLWYRCPELLLGSTCYGSEIDVWSLGCIMVELITRRPLFPGDTDDNQLPIIKKVFRIPYCSIKCHHSNLQKIVLNLLKTDGINLLSRLLEIDPKHRISCSQALKLSYFDDDDHNSSD